MITWLWNIRHRKLLEETKAMVRLYFFLRYEVGLKEVDSLNGRELKQLLLTLKRGKI